MNIYSNMLWKWTTKCCWKTSPNSCSFILHQGSNIHLKVVQTIYWLINLHVNTCIVTYHIHSKLHNTSHRDHWSSKSKFSNGSFTFIFGYREGRGEPILVRLWQLEFPFLIRWTSKNLAALPKEKNDGPPKKTKQEIIHYANNILY